MVWGFPGDLLPPSRANEQKRLNCGQVLRQIIIGLLCMVIAAIIICLSCSGVKITTACSSHLSLGTCWKNWLGLRWRIVSSTSFHSCLETEFRHNCGSLHSVSSSSSFSFVLSVGCFWNGVTLSHMGHMIFLSLPPRYWGYRHVQPCSANVLEFYVLYVNWRDSLRFFVHSLGIDIRASSIQASTVVLKICLTLFMSS